MSQPLEYQEDNNWDTVRRNDDVVSSKLRQPLPQVRVFNSVVVPVNNAAATTIPFDSERYDNGDMHSTTVNNTRLTCKITGLYNIGAAIRWTAAAGGSVRQVRIVLNGANIIGLDERSDTAGNGAASVTTTEWHLTAGDFIEVVVFQNSGGALNVLSAPAFSPEFWMHRIGGFTNEGIA